MAKLIYSAIASLDGYVADEDGDFGWAEPDDEVHRFVNDAERAIGTYLYGRRMYETMVYWERNGLEPDRPEYVRDYAGIWREADKVVYSTTLDAASSARTRIAAAFEPGTVSEMKAAASSDISIGGPNLAAQALSAGLVDEIHIFVAPAVVGGGNACLPSGLDLRLELLGERSFANGTAYLQYRVES